MDVDQEKLSHSLFELQTTIRRAMRELARRELDNIVQVQIACELLNGRRTVAELVEVLFGLKQGDQGYTTHYSQIEKELRVMGSRGLVSRKPFGRDKPYALTQSGVAKLTILEEVKKDLSYRSLPRNDVALYAIVLVLGFTTVWMATGAMGDDIPLVTIAFVFMFIGGVAFCRFMQALLRVIS